MTVMDWMLAGIAFSFAVSLLTLIVMTVATRRDRISPLELEGTPADRALTREQLKEGST